MLICKLYYDESFENENGMYIYFSMERQEGENDFMIEWHDGENDTESLPSGAVSETDEEGKIRDHCQVIRVLSRIVLGTQILG